MSLGDCPECWDALCTCGYEYRRWSNDRIIAQRDMLQGILDRRATQPRCHEPLPYGGTCESQAGHEGGCTGPGAHLSAVQLAKVDWGATIEIPISAIERDWKKP